MKYFSNVQSLDDLKQQFKKLAKKYHPDVQGGSNEIMKQVNAEYEYLKKLLHEQVGKKETKAEQMQDVALRAMLEHLARYPQDVEIELCGVWIWVSGNTYPVKEDLKEKGFKWSRPKKKWYWCPYELGKKKRINTPMDQIRKKYGSFAVKRNEPLLLENK
jgi:hypothetical protein